MKREKLLTVIANHNQNQGALQLKKGFESFCKTILIDSGSKISPKDKKYFDIQLENVYYNGILNKAYELVNDGYTHLFFITSDVQIEDYEALIERILKVYDQESVGVYAPSAKHSTHNHMNNKKTGGLRKITFTEGFCFVVPKTYLDEFCPIDLSINKIGHGIDIYLGYLAMQKKEFAVVDDLAMVHHPQGSGYSDREARIQRDRWFATHKRKAQIFHYFASVNWLKNQVGFIFIRLLMRYL